MLRVPCKLRGCALCVKLAGRDPASGPHQQTLHEAASCMITASRLLRACRPSPAVAQGLRDLLDSQSCQQALCASRAASVLSEAQPDAEVRLDSPLLQVRSLGSLTCSHCCRRTGRLAVRLLPQGTALQVSDLSRQRAVTPSREGSEALPPALRAWTTLRGLRSTQTPQRSSRRA